jgi:integrase
MSVKKLSDGRWQARWRDAAGKQRARRFDTKADAKAYEAEMILQTGRGAAPVVVTSSTVAELADQWLAASINLAAGTIATYRRDLTRYILPKFGAMDPAKVTAPMIQAWLTAELDDYAPSSVHRHYRVLRTMFGWAVRQDQLTLNPCDRVQPPRVPAKTPRFLTAEQVEQIAAELPDRYRALVLVAAYGGLRWGEAIGLRRGDVDGARLTITSQLQQLNGRWLRSEPKTAAGRRMVVLPESVAAELNAHMQKYSSDHPEGLVFINEHGHPVGKSFRHNLWVPALARCGLVTVERRSGRRPIYGKGPTFHDLRHTSVALAISAGAHPKAIQSRLGHASIGMTMNTYGHLLDDGSGLAADLDKLRPQN